MMKKILFFTLIALSCTSILLAATPVSSDMGKKVRTIIWEGLASTDPIIRQTAIRMARQLPAKEAFTAIRPLYGSINQIPDTPGFSIWFREALTSLYLSDPGATVSLVNQFGENLWSWISPTELASIIGIDKLAAMDNINYWTGLDNSVARNDADSMPVAGMLVAYQSHTNAQLAELVPFFTWSELSVRQFETVYTMLKNEKLPTEGLLLGLRARARLIAPYNTVNQSPTLDMLLCQALAYRFGVSKQKPDAGMVSAIPAIGVNLAIARFWAGIAQEADCTLIVAALDQPILLDVDQALFIVHAPSSPFRLNLLQIMLNKAPIVMRHALLRSLLDETDDRLPAINSTLLTQCTNSVERAWIVELIGRTQGLSSVQLWLDQDREPLLRLVASGQFLASTKGGKP